MEERVFARELSGEEKTPEDASQLLRLGGLLTDRWGRINIQIGDTIALDDLISQLDIERRRITPARRRAIVKRLAHQAMSEINRVTGVTPGALVALVLLSFGRRGVSYRDLSAQCRRLTSMLLDMGARATPSLADERGQFRERGIREALRLYVKSGNITQHVPGDTLTREGKQRAALYTGTDVIFTVEPSKRLRLDFAKNHIIHWLVDRALMSLALLCDPGDTMPPAVPRAVMRERVQSLSRLFKFEFMFRADAPFDEIFDDVLTAMVAADELALDGDDVTVGAGHLELDGIGWLTFYANLVRNFVEAYLIAARSLTLLAKGPMARKELVSRALRTGERMFLQGEIELSESVSQPMIDNAFSAFIDQGYLLRDNNQLTLAESFQSHGAATAVEARVAAFKLEWPARASSRRSEADAPG
jgi:glycerol-3-phosphate O-acyltransferase